MKPAISGEIEITAGDRVLRKDMNTFTRGFMAWFCGLFESWWDMNRNIWNDNPSPNPYFGLVNFTGASLNSVGTGNTNTGVAHPYIYFDYDAGVDGYNKEYERIQNLYVATADNPQRDDFNFFNNTTIESSWNEATKAFTLSKVFRNDSGATKTIKRIFLLTPYYPRISGYGTGVVNTMLVLACEEVDFAVWDGESVKIQFELSFSGLGYNVCEGLIQKLSPYVNDVGLARQVRWIDSGGTLRENNANSRWCFGGRFCRMLVGDNATAWDYQDYAIQEIDDVDPIMTYSYIEHEYNALDDTYDLKFLQFFHNNSGVEKTITEIGLTTTGYNSANTEGTVTNYPSTIVSNYTHALMHREVLDTPIVMAADEVVEITMIFKISVAHGS